MKKFHKFLVILSSLCLLTGCQVKNTPSGESSHVVYQKRIIKFESNGGTTYADVVAEHGEQVRLPVPLKKGYNFEGWYNNRHLMGTKYEGIYTPTQSSITFYAKWESSKIVLHFEDSGVQDIVLNEPETITLPEGKKYGYRFEGWKLDPSSTDLITGEYNATESTTFYGQFHKVNYLYMYLNNSADYRVAEYEPGATITLADLETPEDFVIDGKNCPFVKWVDEDTGEDLPAQITLNKEETCIKAVYDTTGIPLKVLIEEVEPGVWKTKGKGVKAFYDDGTHTGIWSMDITAPKSVSGATGLTIRLSTSGRDYAFEDPGTSYISITYSGSSGAIQVGKVINGSWGVVKTLAFDTLPATYQAKINSTNQPTVNLMAVSNEYSFAIYLDGEKIYTNSDAGLLSQVPGTGFGYRSSAKGYYLSNLTFDKGKKIRLDTNGGIPMDDVFYYDGGDEIVIPDAVTNEPNKVFDGWYYEKECINRVDFSTLVVTDNTILYAGWRAPTNQYLVSTGVGSYKLTAKTAVNIVNDAPERYSVEGDLTFKKAGGGSFGFILRSNITSDNSYETGNSYLACQMLPNNGGFQFSNYLDSFNHLGGLYCVKDGSTVTSPAALSKLPDSWRTKYNAASSGDALTVNLKVVETGNGLEIYIDNVLAFTTDASPFTGLIGRGVGFKTSQSNVTCANFAVTTIA